MIQAKTTTQKSLPHFSAQLRAFAREASTEERTIELIVREETTMTAVFEVWLHGAWSFLIEAYQVNADATELIAVVENPNWYDNWKFMFLPVWNELLGLKVVSSELSPREAEIYELVRAGLERTDIAKRLNISKKTVDTHINSMSIKLEFQGTGIRALRRFINKSP